MIIEASEQISLRLRLTDVDQSEEESFLEVIVIYIIYIIYNCNAA